LNGLAAKSAVAVKWRPLFIILKALSNKVTKKKSFHRHFKVCGG